MIAFGRYGMYGGKICFFTHVNPRTNEVWSDDIKSFGTKFVKTGDNRTYAMMGDWVRKDKVQWIKKGASK